MTLKQQYIREGLERGIEKGIVQGLQEGRHRTLEEMARKLLASGMAPADVAEMVEWPLERVLALRH